MTNKPYMDINDQSIPLFSNPFVLTIFGKRSYHLIIVDHDIEYTGKHQWGKTSWPLAVKLSL